MLPDDERYSAIQFTLDLAIILLICFAFLSCTTSRNGVFGKRTLREKYEDKITSAGLKQTVLGNQWFNAAQKGLNQPLKISLPYKETGYFAADKPDAEGFVFKVRQGEKIAISIIKKPAEGFHLFADLWRISAGDNAPQFVDFVDSTNTLEYTQNNNDSLLLRLQPELLQNCEYTVTISAGPSLAFPVQSSANPHIGSFWGASRDAGARKHEGIDIFGKFRTPVVAAADGYITGVNENRLGGKVVWLRPEGKNYTLYYAHLDSQIAKQGMFVKTGDVVGLMGNTGNAKNTPTHLHFGIYTFGGAVDPLPFVNPKPIKPADITASLNNLNKETRNTKATALYISPDVHSTKRITIEKNNLLYVKAATASYYKVQLPDSSEGFISSNVVTETSPLRNLTMNDSAHLYASPDTGAPSITVLNDGEKVDLLASFNDFYYVQNKDKKGWILK